MPSYISAFYIKDDLQQNETTNIDNEKGIKPIFNHSNSKNGKDTVKKMVNNIKKILNHETPKTQAEV